MAQRAGGPVRLLLAGLILVLAVAGLLAQAGFMLREGSDQLSAPTTHPLRDLLTEADRTIPPGQRYAIPSDVRADNARYFLYPRQRVAVAAFDRDTLRRAGVRWVIVTNDRRPPQLSGARDWFRVVLRSAGGRLIEVEP